MRSQDCLPQRQAGDRLRQPARAGHRRRCSTQRGVPAFAAPESCTAALAACCSVGRWPSAPCRSARRDRPVRCRRLPAGSLDEAQAKQLFARFGVPCAREIVVGDAGGAPSGRARARRPGRAEDPVARDHAQERRRRRRGQRRRRSMSARGCAAMADEVEAHDRRAARAASWCRRWSTGGTELILGLHRDRARHRPSCWAWAASRPNCSRTPRCACCRSPAA